jgi:hypothetical protein
MTTQTESKQGLFVEDTQIDAVQNSYAHLHGVIQNLEGAIHPDIIKRLKEIQGTIHQAFKPYWDAQDAAFDSEMDELDKIAKEHGLNSIWSMSSVKSHQMDKPCSLKIKQLTYQSWGKSQTREIKGKKSWLDIWKIADELMQASGDSHHVFIEGFEDLGEGKFRMYAGS